MNPGPLWRVFPWDPNAAKGERFSAAFVPGGQGRNRFDLRGSALGVLYLAGNEEHAVAEMIQGYRNSTAPLANDDLTVWGHRYALVSVGLAWDLWPGIEDLCEPAALAELQITADRPAYRDRRFTQQIASTLHASGRAGLRWWSAFWGEWHTTVLFRDRIPADAITYGTPVPLDIAMAPVVEAARLLDVG
ncbi:MAG: RES family NAD+ phosphorylase [Gemmatimonadota bacterium]